MWEPYQIRIRVRINQHQHKGAAGRRLLEGTQLLVNYLGLFLSHPSGNPLALEVSTGISIQLRQLRHSVIKCLLKVSQCHTFAIGLALESYLHPSQILLALVLKLVQVEAEVYRNAVHFEILGAGAGFSGGVKDTRDENTKGAGPRTYNHDNGRAAKKKQVETKR